LPSYGSGFLVGKQSFAYRIPKLSLGTSVSSGFYSGSQAQLGNPWVGSPCFRTPMKVLVYHRRRSATHCQSVRNISL